MLHLLSISDHLHLSRKISFALLLCLCSISFGSQIYREVEDPSTHQLIYHSATATAGPLHGVALYEPYKPLDAIDLKRYAARKNETTYCYDFPLVTCWQPLVFPNICYGMLKQINSYHEYCFCRHLKQR